MLLNTDHTVLQKAANRIPRTSQMTTKLQVAHHAFLNRRWNFHYHGTANDPCRLPDQNSTAKLSYLGSGIFDSVVFATQLCDCYGYEDVSKAKERGR